MARFKPGHRPADATPARSQNSAQLSQEYSETKIQSPHAQHEPVSAAPLLDQGFFSTAFHVQEFQSAASRLVDQLKELVSTQSPGGQQDSDLDATCLRFQTLPELEAQALSHTTIDSAPLQLSDQTAEQDEAGLSAAVQSEEELLPRSKVRRPSYVNRPGKAYKAPEDAQHAAAARAAALERVRSAWQEQLHGAAEAGFVGIAEGERAFLQVGNSKSVWNAAQGLRTAAQTITGQHKPTKDANYRAGIDSAPAPALQDPPSTSTGSASTQTLAADEVILTIAIHKPEAPSKRHQEVAVLGSQTLDVLRDALDCANDANMAAAERYKHAAFIYVEGAFYNDCRQGHASDLSAPVREFLRGRQVGAPLQPAPGACEGIAPSAEDSGAEQGSAPATDFAARDMSSVTFAQLGLRAGPAAGYSLCHQGCCEHLLAITDVRMVHPHDPQLRSAYPLLVFQAYSNKRVCSTCERQAATKLTYGDIAAHENPAFWCQTCYDMLHYDAAGQLLDPDHKVFPYTGG